MSLYDYQQSLRVPNVSFDALIMAAMRKADSINAYALQVAFPNVWDELQQRYNAPGGLLAGETDDDE